MLNTESSTNICMLPKGYAPWWYDVAGHLGGIYPFQDSAMTDVCSLEIGTIIENRRARGELVKLDPTALVAKATGPYLFGNRTLVEGISRAPWMAHPDVKGDWHPAPLPVHGTEKPDQDSFVHGLKTALLDEARAYIQGAKTVGILLSGGMDSRVVAGVVRALQEESDNAFAVIGLTWGLKTCRDVIYAQRITEIFGWDWNHYPITADTLAANISYMGAMGAEVSPLHLHAMPQVARTDGLDVVLAGSYGDSVGRAEFSGRRVTKLKSALHTWLDRLGVLRKGVVSAAGLGLCNDVVDTPHMDEQTPVLRRREIEQEMHYMRRMLQSCMLAIARDKRFYQLFTAPDVFGRMWSLDPAIRDDEWYKRLLALLPGDLLKIPWARTGRRYDCPESLLDNNLKLNHAYGSWLRDELRYDVLQRINSERVRGMGIFNDRGLDIVLCAWKRAGTASTNSLDELVSWLASLHDFMEIYKINAKYKEFSPSPLDAAKVVSGGIYAHVYIMAREIMRA